MSRVCLIKTEVCAFHGGASSLARRDDDTRPVHLPMEVSNNVTSVCTCGIALRHIEHTF